MVIIAGILCHVSACEVLLLPGGLRQPGELGGLAAAGRQAARLHRPHVRHRRDGSAGGRSLHQGNLFGHKSVLMTSYASMRKIKVVFDLTFCFLRLPKFV